MRAEEAARQAGDARVSIRLAGEFHIRLGELAGNTLLRRYLGELVSRCSLILALYGRPHSADCAVNEHREIVAAFAPAMPRPPSRSWTIISAGSKQRALFDQGREAGFDLGAVLSRYAGQLDGAGPTEGRPAFQTESQGKG